METDCSPQLAIFFITCTILLYVVALSLRHFEHFLATIDASSVTSQILYHDNPLLTITNSIAYNANFLVESSTIYFDF